MPRYCFKCPECGETAIEIRTIAARNIRPPCEACGSVVLMERDMLSEQTKTPLTEFHKPIEMYSMAPETPEQLADLRRKCPDVEFNDLLVPLARSRAEKLQILKAVGGVELS